MNPLNNYMNVTYEKNFSNSNNFCVLLYYYLYVHLSKFGSYMIGLKNIFPKEGIYY